MRKIVFFILFLFVVNITFSQGYEEQRLLPGVPFLTIIPDARGGAMGDIGAATTTDLSSIFYNPAKYSFAEKRGGIQLSYSPWLHKIASDMSINYISGYFKINKNQAFAAEIKYFSIGEVQFTNDAGDKLTTENPNEYSFTGAYSMKMSDNFSGAISLRLIISDLTSGFAGTKTGIAAAGDLSFYYNKPFLIKGKDATFSWGINFSNMGTKISYGSYTTPFIPTNLRTGIALNYKFDDFNALQWGLDFNKLMIPTPPVYNEFRDSIIAGYDYDVSVAEGIVQSFYDAPNGFIEEMHEINIGTGLEYSYNNLLFLRTGVFYEHQNKGGRRYLTTGIGFKFNIFNIDVSYLVPIYSHSPLEATLRFTLAFYFK